MVCDLVPQLAGANAIADLLSKDCKGKRVLFVRNPQGETSAMDRLVSCEAIVESMDIYRQVPVPELPKELLNALSLGKIHCITATSKNIARQTVSLLGHAARRYRWLCLSPSIAQCLSVLGCRDMLISPQPTFDALVALCDENAARDRRDGLSEME
jgi:uroporphyrinogen-III synthase